MREFLARSRVPYRWYPCDTAEGQRLLEAAGVDARLLPVLITDQAEVLIDPTPAELAAIQLYENETKGRTTVLQAVERELRISAGSGSQS